MKSFINKHKEILILFVLFILIFLIEAYDDRHSFFYWWDVFFVLQYFLASLLISYVIIPKFFYQKKWIKFSLSIIGTFVLVGLVEEFVLEQIFYPESRGQITLVFHTFLEIFPPIFIFVGIKFAWDALENKNKIEKLNRISAENELQFLNSQINPHFLFNNLNNLYASALENSPKTPQIILQLSSILRYMLYDCRKPKVDISDEIDNLNQFIALYKLQVNKDAKVEFNYLGENSNLQIAPLILIVFVENAFKHSQASLSEQIEIKIQLELKRNQLHFSCANTYGDESNTSNLHKGIGLENVKNKLNIVYPKQHQLDIKKKDNWFSVQLKIDLSYD